MKKSTSFLTLQIIVVMNLIIYAGTYGGGSGTSGSPYLISTASHLYELYGTSGDWGSYFRQENNISVTGTWTPIGNSTTKFTGSYNGQGYLVSGVSMDDVASNGYWGFFGYTNGATIENLGVSVSLNCKSSVGGLIGYAQTSTVTGCYTTGSVSGYYGYVGGLIGESSGTTISTCYSTTTVTGGTSGSGSYTGGLVGKCANGSPISNSYHITNNVSGKDYVGGLVGGLETSSSVSQCYSTGSVTGTIVVGGLVGALSASIENSYSRANVSNSGSNSGGLVGQSSSGTINKCFSTGTATGSSSVGGLLGYNSSGTTTNSFWDTETSSLGSSEGGTGKTTAQMKTQSTFTDASWSSSIWNMDAGYNDGYPHLDWQNTGGTPLPVELTSFIANVNDGDVILEWQTATEVDNYGFDIQRSVISGQRSNEWEKIGFVTGYGNSNSPKHYFFIDENITASGKYFYRLKQIDNDGSYDFSPIVLVEIENPKEFALEQNYPNPFNPNTVISYQLSASGKVTLKIYDVLGKEIAMLVNEEKESGVYEVEFDASYLAGGVYLYELVANDYRAVKKLMVIK